MEHLQWNVAHNYDSTVAIYVLIQLHNYVYIIACTYSTCQTTTTQCKLPKCKVQYLHQWLEGAIPPAHVAMGGGYHVRK